MNKRFLKSIATVIAVSLVCELLTPLAVYALTSGPSQPEFSSFEPVATTNMVSEFTGAFTYNLPLIQIPGPNGGDYALSLSYHSGTSSDEEASWVGYGWTLNPGSISRNTRGFPDDYYGSDVTYYNKTKKNWTVSVGTVLGIEAFSLDKGGGFNIGGISGNYSLRLNSYRGYGYVAGFNAHAAGLVSFGYSVADGRSTHSWSISPARFLMNLAQGFAAHGSDAPAVEQETKSWGNEFGQRMGEKLKGRATGAYDAMFNFYGIHSFQDHQRAVNTASYSGESFNVTTGLQYTGIPFVGLQGQLTGNYSSQENTPFQTLKTWGYMYSGHATTNTASMMDYYTEKDVPYTMRDKFLSIPFSNADNFMLAGEGLGGGFRMYNAKPGHFRKNAVTSSLSITQVGAEGSVGASIGAGADYGTGSQSLEVKEWSFDPRYHFATAPVATAEEAIDEPYFFRFNNDMGGSVSFEHKTWDSEDKPRRGRDIAHEINPVMNTGRRSGRSSFIAYHTNQEMSASGNTIVGYSRDRKISDNQVFRKSSAISRGVGEVAVYNEQGSRYVYGLPVYSMKEQTLQYGNRVNGNGPQLLPDADRYRATYSSAVTGPGDANTKYVVGEERNQPYATSFLLTEITTPDYVDLTTNGPTKDDLGGYVRFAYKRSYGSYAKDPSQSSSWYKWRIPYAGMLYQRNELSEPDDNTGSVMNGYKEIYYLDTIETRTHYAVFVTSDRLDGLGAEMNEGTALTDLNAKNTGAVLQKLDRIKLYAKGADGVPGSDDKLLYTVCLDYDYSLCQGLPNTNGTGADDGKLTLKKVWFEYEGVVNTRITPYVFGYEYRTKSWYANLLSQDMIDKYTGIVGYGDTLSALAQNPPYHPCNMDPWGSYQKNGAERYRRMQSWVNQKPQSDFDPAAWQLKWIHLPTGGEIHVQYEQNDYTYVQDRRALAMVQIDGASTPDGNRFFLNLGASLPTVDPQDVVDLIQTEIINKREEMYFRILYSLYKNQLPDLNNAEITKSKDGAEYITGYSLVSGVGISGGKVYVDLERKPRQVGLDLVEAQKAGREERDDFPPVTIGNVFQTVVDFMSNFGRTFFDEASTCTRANWDESYLRIPIPVAKKGGGIRVKRLLMVDPGLDGAGSGNLYGSEYDYSMIDENTGKAISSGVAANEPGAMRQENALVTSLKKRFDQTAYQRATAGEDKEQFEGPIGESILPGASVGYARVVSKNIHNGVTGNGFSVHEFYTARDYPYDKYYPHLEGNAVEWTDMALSKQRSQLSLILSNKTYENIEAQQGYRFVINSMHGQVKRIAAYGGDYSDEGTWVLSTLQEYTYFEPGEKVPMFDGPEQPLRYDSPGKEMEIVFESRHITDKTDNFSLEVDVSFIGLPFPIPTAFPTWNKNESILKTHVTTKVVRYPAIQKTVMSYADGIYHLTEHVAFHPATGKPVVMRTTDGYDKLSLYGQPAHNGALYNYNVAAEQGYPEMGQKSGNERAVVYTSTATFTINKTGLTLNFTGQNALIDHALTQQLYPGDLIDLTYTTGLRQKCFVAGTDVQNNTVTLEHVYPAITSTDGAIRKIDVLRSGRVNNLAAMEGSVTTYGENKQSAFSFANELAKRQRLVNLLNNGLLRGRSLGLHGWNTFGVKFRISNIHPDSSSSLVRELTPEHGIGVKFTPTTIEFSPRRVTCGDSVQTHPLVAQLNASLDQLWGMPITTGSASVYCGGLLTRDYQYPVTNATIALMQGTTVQTEINNLIAVSTTCTPWPWYDHFANMVVTMKPTTPSGFYNRQTVTALQQGVGLRKLTSLEIRYGDRSLLRCYVTTGTCQYTWGCLPDIPENLPNGVTYNDFSGTTTASYAVVTGQFTQNIGKFGQTTDGLLFFDCFLNSRRYYYRLRFEKSALDESVPPTGMALTTSITKSPLGPGRFALDANGQIVYYAAGSSTPISIPCLESPNGEAGVPARVNAGPDATRVIAASAQTYADDWQFDATEYGVPTGMADYQRGRRGKWRAKSSYVYKAAITDAVSGGTADRVYNAGIFTQFTPFNRTAPAQQWLKLNTVTKYSPFGEALEEEDILGIASTARFAHSNTMPALVARNAANSAVTFVSFEDQAGVSSTYAHSGRYSYLLGSGTTYTTGTLEMNAKLRSQGVQVKFWVRTPTFGALDGSFQVRLDRGGSMTAPTTFRQVARSGEWALYEAVYSPSDIGLLADGSFTVKLQGGASDVYIDDVRVQPLDAQMTTYVYDAVSLRVVAIMDDQHFGMYYQYNAEGKLVRKIKETERGMKTLAETQYHTPMVDRTQTFAMMMGGSMNDQLPPYLRDATRQNPGILQQLLEQQGSGSGTRFDYEKRLTLPEDQLRLLQQQVDSVNDVTRRLAPQPPQSSTPSSTRQNAEER